MLLEILFYLVSATIVCGGLYALAKAEDRTNW